jgi:hypothetical protein
MRTTLRIAVSSCLVALTTGCALGNRHIVLTYPPPPSSSGGGPAVAEAAPAPLSSAMPIVVIPFNDTRTDTLHVGEVKNALGMRTAWVLSDSDVSEWVTAAVTKELERSGYQVTRTANAADAGGTPMLSGDILKVFGSAYMTYGGDVTLLARVTRDGKEIHQKTYTSHQMGGMSLTASGGGYSNALAAALAEDIRALIADLNGVMPKP